MDQRIKPLDGAPEQMRPGASSPPLKWVRPDRFSLQDHAQLDERWVQSRIAEDPTILGLGDLVLRDRERPQPRAGRLDLLLQDPETNRRYEIEVQLGPTDESHIVRTIEYWDLERKRYPQYDHCAVIVAEDITARFLNVISLFNGSIPIIAIQMQGLRFEEKVALVFTTVLNELTRGLVDEDEEVRETADRAYWEERATKETVAMADRLLELVHQYDPKLELKYNKFYIGLAKDGRPNNFVSFKPQKKHLKLEVKLKQSDEIEKLINESGLDVLTYDARWGLYPIRLSSAEVARHMDLLGDIVGRAYNQSRL
jgi:predicted transport protein